VELGLVCGANCRHDIRRQKPQNTNFERFIFQNYLYTLLSTLDLFEVGEIVFSDVTGQGHDLLVESVDYPACLREEALLSSNAGVIQLREPTTTGGPSR